MTASTSHPITISPYLKGIGFETRTTPLVDSNVDWNGRESRSVPFEFEAGREYCLSHQVVVHTNFGRTTWGVESSLVADSDFIQESKIHQLFKSLFNASESIEDSAERDKTRISLQKDKEMLMDMYLRVRSAHQRITYHWAVKGSGNFFDRKGGSLHLSLEFQVMHINLNVLEQVQSHHLRQITAVRESLRTPMTRSIDTLFQDPRTFEVYFFKDNKFIACDPSGKVTKGPQKISKRWKQLKTSPTATFQLLDGKFYVFHKNRFTVYEGDQSDPRTSKKIKTGWPTIPFDDVDAAIPKLNSSLVYFFKGGAYVQYDLSKQQAKTVKLIKNHWKGLPEDGIDAGFDAGNGKWYFFKGTQYYRFDWKKDETDAGYPKKITRGWKNVSFD